MGVHAFLSPSFGKIGYNCPAAAIRSFQVKQRMELLREIAIEYYGLKTDHEKMQMDKILEEDNAMAQEGTALHTVFEDCLNSDKIPSKSDMIEMVSKQMDVSDSTKNDDYIMQQLFDRMVEQYEFTRDCDDYGIEFAVNVAGIPQFGTVDIVGNKDTTLYVNDLKTGYGEVKAEKNEQLMTYAVGILDELGWDRFKHIEITIVGIRWESTTWKTTPYELRKFKEEVMLPAFMKAYSINPEAKAGDHCQYCVAKIHCKEWQQKFNKTANETFNNLDVEDMPTEDLVDLYKLCKQAENLSKYSLSQEILHRFDGFDTPTGVTKVSGAKITKWNVPEADVVKALGKKVKNKNLLYKQTLLSPKDIKVIVKSGDDDDEFKALVKDQVRKPYLKL